MTTCEVSLSGLLLVNQINYREFFLLSKARGCFCARVSIALHNNALASAAHCLIWAGMCPQRCGLPCTFRCRLHLLILRKKFLEIPACQRFSGMSHIGCWPISSWWAAHWMGTGL